MESHLSKPFTSVGRPPGDSPYRLVDHDLEIFDQWCARPLTLNRTFRRCISNLKMCYSAEKQSEATFIWFKSVNHPFPPVSLSTTSFWQPCPPSKQDAFGNSLHTSLPSSVNFNKIHRMTATEIDTSVEEVVEVNFSGNVLYVYLANFCDPCPKRIFSGYFMHFALWPKRPVSGDCQFPTPVVKEDYGAFIN